jgi:hypothetical protein
MACLSKKNTVDSRGETHLVEEAAEIGVVGEEGVLFQEALPHPRLPPRENKRG